MASKKEHYLVTQKKKEDQAMLPYFEKMYIFQSALYHPDTQKKMFIFDSGLCIKRDCSTASSIHKAKVLVPRSTLTDFSCEINSEDRVVICFSHFSFQDRMTYLNQGMFPERISLLRTIRKDSEPQPKKIRVCTEALNKDTTWVTFLCYIFIF